MSFHPSDETPNPDPSFPIDSSRRAVEAADNVVHAYDLNMQVPDTPIPAHDDDSMEMGSTPDPSRRPSLLLEGNTIFFKRNKRQRTSSAEWDAAPAAKHRVVQSTNSTPHRDISPHTASLRTAVEESDSITSGRQEGLRPGRKARGTRRQSSTMMDPDLAFEAYEPEAVMTPGLRHTKIRDLLRLIINESLRVGGRPDSAVAEDTDGGEIIEVRTRNPNGESVDKIIDWSVDSLVPEMIFGKSFGPMVLKVY